MGPVITCASRDRITGLIDKGVAEGATLVVDGRGPSIAGGEKGRSAGRVGESLGLYREERGHSGEIVAHAMRQLLQQHAAVAGRAGQLVMRLG